MPVRHRRTQEFKPLLFDTTLRNPKRIKQFLKVISKYNGTVPKDIIVDLIVEDVIQEKLYKPTYVKNNPILNDIFEDEDKRFSKKQLQEIIKKSPQDHQEGGFSRGWPSRFFTWFKFIRALGFVYFDVDKPIEVSATGKKLIQAFDNDDSELEKAVFRNALARFHRSSPFIMASNKNRPFPLLIATILKLKEITKDETKGVYRFEIPYFLCWRDSNVDSLANYILEQRNRLGLRPSDESIYDNAKEILQIGEERENLYKMSNILREMPDEYIRKMRLTGMIILRGGGRMLDIGSDYLEDAKYISQNYLEFLSFSSETDYFKYAGGWDQVLGKYSAPKTVNPTTYMAKFDYQVSLYSLDIIREEFLVLGRSNGRSNHPLFRLLDKSIRLEFLTALLLKKTFPALEVVPNYPADDEGIPTSTAGGSTADINCKDAKRFINVEVTMLTSTEQNVRESASIISHLQDTQRYCPDAFTVFIAPKIHNQTSIFLQVSSTALSNPNLKFKLFNIQDFEAKIKTVSTFEKIGC